MKTFEVEGPDGVVYPVIAPEGTPKDELIRAAQASAAARPKPATTSEKFLASGVGRYVKGMKDSVDAGAQLLPRGLAGLTSGLGFFPNPVSQWFDKEAAGVDSDIQQSEGEYQAARWKDGQSGLDGARLVGNILNPVNLAIAKKIPSGAVTTLGRAFQGGVGGALGGVAATPVTGAGDVSFGMQKLGQGVSGAVGGAVMAPVLGKVLDVAAPRIKALQAKFTDPDTLSANASIETTRAIRQVFDDMGVEAQNVPPDVLAALRSQVLASFKQGQRLDAASALRKMDFEAQGVPALRGQVTRNPAQYSRDMNLRGVEDVGEPIQGVLTAQNRKITSDLGKFGATEAAEKFPAGDKLMVSLGKFDEDMNGAVSRAYKNARASSGKDWDIPTKGLAYDVQNVVENFGVGGEQNAIPSAIFNRLKKLGIVGDDMTQRQVFNYEEADKLLKQVNAHMKGGSNGSLSALHASLKKAILEGGGDGDPFAPARKLAAERFGLLDAVPALKAVVDGKASADDFVSRYIVGGKVRELQKLSQILPPEDMAEAKRQIAKVIYKGAFEGNAAGDKLASPAGLQSAMKNIGTDKLKVFFSQPEIDELNRITRITAYANSEPAWGTVARGGNPGGVLFGGLARMGMAGAAAGRQLPGLGPMLSSGISAGRTASQASAALNASVPKSANLTAEEIATLNGLLGVSSVSAGGLLAPRP